MNIIVVTYIVYVVLCITLTVWVARTLFKNGRVFLVNVFHGDEALAESVNHLLVVGFYLINLGYMSLALKISESVDSVSEGIEALSWKLGWCCWCLALCTFSTCIFSAVFAAPWRAMSPLRRLFCMSSHCCSSSPTQTPSTFQAPRLVGTTSGKAWRYSWCKKEHSDLDD